MEYKRMVGILHIGHITDLPVIWTMEEEVDTLLQSMVQERRIQ